VQNSKKVPRYTPKGGGEKRSAGIKSSLRNTTETVGYIGRAPHSNNFANRSAKDRGDKRAKVQKESKVESAGVMIREAKKKDQAGLRGRLQSSQAKVNSKGAEPGTGNRT